MPAHDSHDSRHYFLRRRPAAAIAAGLALTTLAFLQARAQPAPSYALNLVGQYGASPQALVAGGDQLFVGLGNRVVSAEVGEDGSLRYLGSSPAMPGPVRALVENEGFVFAGGGEGYVWVLDTREPPAIRRLARIDLPGSARRTGEVLGLAVAGDTVFALGRDRMLSLIDITRPDSPWLLSSIRVGDIEVDRPTKGDLLVDGDWVYLRTRGGMNVVDASDRHRPRALGFFQQPNYQPSRSMFKIDDSIFLLTKDTIRRVDVSIPARPRQVDQLPIPGMIGGGQVGRRVYLLQQAQRKTNQTPDGPEVEEIPAALVVYDFDDPARPEELSRQELGGKGGLLFDGPGALYQVDAALGVQRYSLAEPLQPQAEGRLEAEHVIRSAVRDSQALVLLQNQGLGQMRLELVDLREPEEGIAIASIALDRAPRDMAWDGRRAYLLYADRLESIDLSQPRSPAPGPGLEGLGRAVGLTIAGDLLLIAEADVPTLRVFDIAGGGLRERGRLSLAGRPGAVSAVGNVAFVATSEGLEAIDIGNPDQPFARGQTSPSDPGGYPGPIEDAVPAVHLDVSGDRLYGAASFGLQVFDIGDPNRPVTSARMQQRNLVGVAADALQRVMLPISIESEDGSAGILQVSQWQAGSTWREIWSKRLSWRPRHLTREGARLYLSASAGGLLILDPADPAAPELPGTPRPSATPIPLPTPTLRPGEAERQHRIYLPWALRPLPKLENPPRIRTRAASGGTARHIAVRGGIVYLQQGDRIAIYDARLPAETRLVGSIDLSLGSSDEWWPSGRNSSNLEWEVVAMQVDGKQLLLLTGPNPSRISSLVWVMSIVGAVLRPTSRLQVFDLSDPLRPTATGELRFEGAATSLSVEGQRGFIGRVDKTDADRRPSGQLLAIETSGRQPRIVGSQAVDGATMRLERRGSRLAALVSNLRSDWTLKLFDASRAEAPRLISLTALEGDGQTGTPALHLGVDSVELYRELEASLILDIRDPAQPILLEDYDFRGQLESDEDASNDLEVITAGFRLAEQQLLIDGWNGRLVALDRASPGMPKFLGALDLPIKLPSTERLVDQHPQAWASEGRRVYLSGRGDGGLVVVDLGPPPTLSGQVSAPGNLGSIAAGSEQFYAIGRSGLEVYSVAGLPEFLHLGRVKPEALRDALFYGSPSDIVLDGSRLLLASPKALDWFELARPAAPLYGKISFENESSRSVASAGSLLYVTEEATGLWIYALDDSEDAPLRGRWFGPGSMQDIAVDRDGKRAYVASGSAGLSILDTSDPAAVREIASLQTASYSQGIAVEDGLGLLLDYELPNHSVLRTLDLGQMPPMPLGRMVLPARALGQPQLVGSKILQRLEDDRLWLLDASDPSYLRLAVEFAGQWRSAALSPDGDLLYLVAEETGQLTVLQLDW